MKLLNFIALLLVPSLAWSSASVRSIMQSDPLVLGRLSSNEILSHVDRDLIDLSPQEDLDLTNLFNQIFLGDPQAILSFEDFVNQLRVSQYQNPEVIIAVSDRLGVAPEYLAGLIADSTLSELRQNLITFARFHLGVDPNDANMQMFYQWLKNLPLKRGRILEIQSPPDRQETIHFLKTALAAAKNKCRSFLIKRHTQHHSRLFDIDPSDVAPSIIHVFWVGGPMRQDLWSNIFTIAELAHDSGYELNIWIDDIRNLQILKQQRDNTGSTSSSKKWDKEWNSALDRLVELGWIKIRDIYELKDEKPDFFSEQAWRELWRVIGSERRGFFNYSAESDAARTLIGYLIGGIWLDTDMTQEPTEDQNQFLEDIRLPYGFRVVRQNASPFATTPRHPVFEAMLIKILIDYLEYETTYKTLSKKELIRMWGISDDQFEAYDDTTRDQLLRVARLSHNQPLINLKRLPPSVFQDLNHDLTPYVKLTIQLGPGLFTWMEQNIISNLDLPEEDYLFETRLDRSGEYIQIGGITIWHQFKRTWDKNSHEKQWSLEN